MYSKRESVDRTLARCRRMLQESPSEEQSTVDVDIQLTVLREQFDALCLRSDRRSVRLCLPCFFSLHELLSALCLRSDRRSVRRCLPCFFSLHELLSVYNFIHCHIVGKKK